MIVVQVIYKDDGFMNVVTLLNVLLIIVVYDHSAVVTII